MKTRLRLFFLAGALAVTVPALALAVGPCKGDGAAHAGRRGPGGPRSLTGFVTRHAGELGISQETLAAMKKAEDTARPELESLHAAVRSARDEVKLGGDRSKLEAAHQAMRTRHQALRTQVSALLTEAQRTKLRELMEKRRAERPRHWRRAQGPDAGA